MHRLPRRRRRQAHENGKPRNYDDSNAGRKCFHDVGGSKWSELNTMVFESLVRAPGSANRVIELRGVEKSMTIIAFPMRSLGVSLGELHRAGVDRHQGTDTRLPRRRAASPDGGSRSIPHGPSASSASRCL